MVTTKVTTSRIGGGGVKNGAETAPLAAKTADSNGNGVAEV